MHFTIACLAGLVVSVVAAPVEKRANTLPPVDSATDESVLQLALYLEHLELALYTGGFENFTDAEYTAAGFPPGFHENVGVIASVCCPASSMIYTGAVLMFFPNSTKQYTPLLSAPSSRKPATLQSHPAATSSPTTHPPLSSI